METAENNFPKLPIRTGELVLVWFSQSASAEHFRAHDDAKIAKSTAWTSRVQLALQAFRKSTPERLILEPTARSWLK